MVASKVGEVTAAGLVLAILLWFAWPGLGRFFVDDDIGNLRRALPLSTRQLIVQTVTFAPDAYRPAGLLWYKTIFHFAGLHPRPYRVISFLTLLLNLGLLAALAYAITRSAGITTLAALLGCFHSRMADIYFSSQNIYDILCYTFFFLALCIYVRRREAGLPASVGPAVCMLLCQILALGAKETAVTLPAVLLAYELSSRRVRPLRWTWWAEAGIALAASFAVSAIFCYQKLVAPGATLSEGYQPSYSPLQVLQNGSAYLAFMVYRNDPVPVSVLAMVLLAVILIVVISRSKALAVCGALIVITPLPVLVVAPRGLVMLYISLTGWAVFIAYMLVWLRRHLSTTRVSQAALFLAVAVLLCFAHYRDRPDHTFPKYGLEDPIRHFVQGLNGLKVTLPGQAQILLLDDPFLPDEWWPNMILQLHFRRPELMVFRPKAPPDHQPPMDGVRFDTVLKWDSGRVTLVPWESNIPGGTGKIKRDFNP